LLPPSAWRATKARPPRAGLSCRGAGAWAQVDFKHKHFLHKELERGYERIRDFRAKMCNTGGMCRDPTGHVTPAWEGKYDRSKQEPFPTVIEEEVPDGADNDGSNGSNGGQDGDGEGGEDAGERRGAGFEAGLRVTEGAGLHGALHPPSEPLPHPPPSEVPRRPAPLRSARPARRVAPCAPPVRAERPGGGQEGLLGGEGGRVMRGGVRPDEDGGSNGSNGADDGSNGSNGADKGADPGEVVCPPPAARRPTAAAPRLRADARAAAAQGDDDVAALGSRIRTLEDQRRDRMHNVAPALPPPPRRRRG
jgi:hypothetical protein